MAEEAPAITDKLETDDPILLISSSSTDHEDDVLRRGNSQRWAGGDNLSATKMSLMLSHMKNRLTDLTQNDEEVQRLAMESSNEMHTPILSSNQPRRSTVQANNNNSMGNEPLSIEPKLNNGNGRSKSPAVTNVSRRKGGEDDGSVVSSYSRRSTISKSQGSVSAQKPAAQRGGSNANTPSKPSSNSAARRASTPNKLNDTSLHFKTPSKPQTSAASGMTTPTSGQRKSMGDNAPGSRSSSANRNRGSTNTTTTASTMSNADRRLYNLDNTRRLSGASAVSSSTTAAANGRRVGAATRPAAAAAAVVGSSVTGARAVSRGAAPAGRTSTSAAGASMKSPPEKAAPRASSAQRSSISAPNSAMKVTINNSSSRASMSSTSSAGDRSQSVKRTAPAATSNEKRATSTTGRSRRAEQIVVPSANLLRSSTAPADTLGPDTPNKAAAVRRPSLGGTGTTTASVPQQQQRSATVTEAEPRSEPKTEDLQKNMQTLARKFAALKVKTPVEVEATELDSPIISEVPPKHVEPEVSPAAVPATSAAIPVHSSSPITARLSRSNSGSSAYDSATPTASTFMPSLSSLERKRSTSPMMRAGSSTNVISPSSQLQSSHSMPFHRTGSANQIIAPNIDRVLRSHDVLDHVITENNGNAGMYGLNHSNSSSGQNLIPVPLKIRLDFPARRILPSEPVVYMESLQHSTPVAIQAIYRAASVSANSSPANKASSNGSASGTPKSGGKRKSGW